MAVGDAYVFPGILTPVLTQFFFSFQSHRLLFSHASAEVRGENTPEIKSRLNRGSNSQPPGHESYTLTTEPPGRGFQKAFRENPKFQKFFFLKLQNFLL